MAGVPGAVRGTVVPAQPALASRTRQLLCDLLELTKPKVQSLLLLTTVASMYVAGDPSLGLVLLTCLGGYLSAGGAGAINHYVTATSTPRCAAPPTVRSRPGASRHGWRCCSGARWRPARWSCCRLAVNPLAAGLSFAGFLGYVFVYTLWLKRRSPQNIVIGGAAGAVPRSSAGPPSRARSAAPRC